MTNQRFRFDHYHFDGQSRTVTCSGRAIRLPPRVFQALEILIQAAPSAVSKTQLYESLWPDTVVEDSTLTQNIYILRKALGERPGGGSYIETIPKFGYRFCGDVTEEGENALEARDRQKSEEHALLEEHVPWWQWGIPLGILTVLAIFVAFGAGPREAQGANQKEARLSEQEARALWRLRGGPNHSPEPFFRKAVLSDPHFEAARTGLAGFLAMKEGGLPEASQIVQQVLAANPNSAEALAVSGFIYMVHKWDLRAAETELRRSLAIDATQNNSVQWYSLVLCLQGRCEEGLHWIDDALTRDPVSANLWTERARIHYFLGDRDAMVRDAEKALTFLPSFSFAHNLLAVAHEWDGNAEGGVRHGFFAESQLGHLLSPQVLVRLLNSLEAQKGVREIVQNRVVELRAMAKPSHLRLAFDLALLGEDQAALDELLMAVRGKEFFVVTATVDPRFAHLKKDPKFQKVLHEIGSHTTP